MHTPSPFPADFTCLSDAIIAKDEEGVKQALIDLPPCDPQTSQRLMMVAIQGRNQAIIQALLDARILLNPKSASAHECWLWAAQRNSPLLGEVLIESVCKPGDAINWWNPSTWMPTAPLFLKWWLDKNLPLDLGLLSHYKYAKSPDLAKNQINEINKNWVYFTCNHQTKKESLAFDHLLQSTPLLKESWNSAKKKVCENWILRDKMNKVHLLIQRNWIEVESTYEGFSEPLLMTALYSGARKAFSYFAKDPKHVVAFEKAWRQNPFPNLLSNTSNVILKKSETFNIDWNAKNEIGDTFAHLCLRNNEIKNLSEDRFDFLWNHCKESFSVENNKGETPLMLLERRQNQVLNDCWSDAQSRHLLNGLPNSKPSRPLVRL